MNKSELIDAVADAADLSKADSARALDEQSAFNHSELGPAGCPADFHRQMIGDLRRIEKIAEMVKKIEEAKKAAKRNKIFGWIGAEETLDALEALLEPRLLRAGG